MINIDITCMTTYVEINSIEVIGIKIYLYRYK